MLPRTVCSPRCPQPSSMDVSPCPLCSPALSEAQDIALHLTPLQQPLELLEAAEFSQVKPLLVPLLHLLCWIWVTCKHYSVPGRMLVLLQEICNLLIQQVSACGTCLPQEGFADSLFSPPFPCPSLARGF